MSKLERCFETEVPNALPEVHSPSSKKRETDVLLESVRTPLNRVPTGHESSRRHEAQTGIHPVAKIIITLNSTEKGVIMNSDLVYIDIPIPAFLPEEYLDSFIRSLIDDLLKYARSTFKDTPNDHNRSRRRGKETGIVLAQYLAQVVKLTGKEEIMRNESAVIRVPVPSSLPEGHGTSFKKGMADIVIEYFGVSLDLIQPSKKGDQRFKTKTGKALSEGVAKVVKKPSRRKSS